MRTPKLLGGALAVSVAALALTACGGNGSNASSDEAAPMGGTTMEAASATQTPSDAVASPAANLRVTLDRLLGEHVYLAVNATRKGYDGAEDFEASAEALDANSVDVADAIGSVYGDEARDTFLDGTALWRDHISFFVDYTVGLAGENSRQQEKAVNDLMGYVEAFSAFLSEATGLPQDALRMGIEEHVMQLKGQIDAYAAGDYAEAHAITREAYLHMVETGDTLAAAIVEQNPDEFTR